MAARLPFTAEAIAMVPEATGAYFLFRGARPLFAGVAAGAANLRSELLAHLRGDFGARTRAATHFAWQATTDALEAYHAQLAAHARWDLREAAAGECPTMECEAQELRRACRR